MNETPEQTADEQRAAHIAALAAYERADASFRATCMKAGFSQDDIAEIERHIADAFGFDPDTDVH